MSRFRLTRTVAVVAVTLLALATPSRADTAKASPTTDHAQGTLHAHKAKKATSKPAPKPKKAKSKTHHTTGDKAAAGGGVVQH